MPTATECGAAVEPEENSFEQLLLSLLVSPLEAHAGLQRIEMDQEKRLDMLRSIAAFGASLYGECPSSTFTPVDTDLDSVTGSPLDLRTISSQMS